MKRFWKLTLIGTSALLLLVLTVVLVAITRFLIGEYRLHTFEIKLQSDWQSFSKVSILDAAIHTYGSNPDSFNNHRLDVPHADMVSYYGIADDSISIEYGGGFHHFGIEYFLDPKKTVQAAQDDPDKHRLTDRMLYYSEDSGRR
jgi:hypothetical protein